MSGQDEKVAQRLSRVLNMVDPPKVLFHPRFMLHVLRGAELPERRAA